MLRNLLKNKVQFFSIFIMSFLGLFVFVGMDSEVAGFTAAEDAFYTECSLSDIWVQGKNFSPDDERKVMDIEGVKKAERRISVKGKALLPDREADMYLNFMGSNEISRLSPVSGEAFVPGEKGVWLDYNFADKNGINLGDTVKFKYEGKEFDAVLRGKVRHPEYVYFLRDTASMMPDYGFYGAAWMDESEYPGEDAYYNELLLDVEGIDNRNALSRSEKELKDILDLKIKDVLDKKTWLYSIRTTI